MIILCANGHEITDEATTWNYFASNDWDELVNLVAAVVKADDDESLASPEVVADRLRAATRRILSCTECGSLAAPDELGSPAFVESA